MNGTDEPDKGNFKSREQFLKKAPFFIETERIKVVKIYRKSLITQRIIKWAWIFWVFLGVIAICLSPLYTFYWWARVLWFLINICLVVPLFATGKLSLRVFFTLQEPPRKKLEEATNDNGTQQFV